MDEKETIQEAQQPKTPGRAQTSYAGAENIGGKGRISFCEEADPHH